MVVLPFGESFAAWTISTGVAAMGGLLFALFVGRYLKLNYFLAFSLGVLLWVFTDVIDEAGKIDVEASFSGGWEQVFIVVLFIAGAVSFFCADRSTFSTSPDNPRSITIPLLLAIAVGAHGLGEGIAFGAVSATTQFVSLVIAFGGEAAGAAYVVHKFLEAMAIGSFYLVCRVSMQTPLSKHLRNLALLAIAFVLPSLVAMGVGYYVQFDAVYFYSIGTGTLLYAILRLTGPLFIDGKSLGQGYSFKTGLWLTAGFLCVYLAALLHSFVS